MTYPFTALVGQDDLRLALLLTAVDPRIGGVLVRGQKGTAKTTAVRALATLLPHVEVHGGCPHGCAADVPDCVADGTHDGEVVQRRARLVELPTGASEDRVVGSLDLEAALVDGRPRFQPGLLAHADRGVLYVDEVNLLADHLVDLLLDAAATGRHRVERDGTSIEHPARLQLIGSMNPEEGELRPQLLDRFGLSVDVVAPADLSQRAEVVRRRLAHDADPAAFADRYTPAEAELARQLDAARNRLPSVALPDEELERIVRVCARFEVEGLRADLVIARAAVAAAAWAGRAVVAVDDVRTAARLALPHRRRRTPFEDPGLDLDALEESLEDPGPGHPPEPGADEAGGGDPGGGDPGGGDPGGGDPGGGPPPPGGGGSAPPSDDPRPADGAPPSGGTASEQPGDRDPVGERSHAVGSAFAPVHLEVPGQGRGASGRRSSAHGPRGSAVGDRRPTPGSAVTDVAVAATVRRAASAQHRRVPRGRGLTVTRDDLRTTVRRGREGNLVVLVVDASGSAGARRRMTAVKGAVRSLLLDAYQRRDRLALVAFRGHDAEVVVPPTSSPDLADRRLADLRTGGRTPLAAGLRCAGDLITAEARRDPDRRPLLVVLTDGRANAGTDARGRAREQAAHLAARGVAGVVVDTEDGAVRLRLAADLATALRAPCVRLEHLAAPELAGLLRTTTRRTT